MIITTAGHVDHGKTTLIRALTGVDTDRLPEEKRRGMTIDLGFAYLPVSLTDGSDADAIGFIDVPGHQDFIRNMLCGACAGDFALLVIAADDGPRAQSVEHLAIVDLLEIRSGVVVLTKINRVSADRLTALHKEIAGLLAGTTLARALIFDVDAIAGRGVAALKSHLMTLAAGWRRPDTRGHFRLAVDRSFNLTGAGLIVTGTVLSGSLATGDSVRILGTDVVARARSIHCQNEKADHAVAGQRCAINLAGPVVKRDAITRGQMIVAGDVPEPQSSLDARMRVAAGTERGIAHWTAAHIHLNASHAACRIAILEGRTIEPGQTAHVRLVLDRPVGAACGDRFIMRDAAAQLTIGGGRVVDMFPPARGRSSPHRLKELLAIAEPDDLSALRLLLDRMTGGVPLRNFQLNKNLTNQETDRLFARASMVRIETETGALGFSRAHWSNLRSDALAVLTRWHEKWPSLIGMPMDRILEGSRHRLPRKTVTGIAAQLAREGVIVRTGRGARLPTHAPRLDVADQALWKMIEPLLVSGALRPPSVAQISVSLRMQEKKIALVLGRVASCGLAVKVAPNRYYLHAALCELAEIVHALAEESPMGRVSTAAFRDRSGIGRNLSIDVLEFFDQMKFTRRLGEHRYLHGGGEFVFAQPL